MLRKCIELFCIIDKYDTCLENSYKLIRSDQYHNVVLPCLYFSVMKLKPELMYFLNLENAYNYFGNS